MTHRPLGQQRGSTIGLSFLRAIQASSCVRIALSQRCHRLEIGAGAPNDSSCEVTNARVQASPAELECSEMSGYIASTQAARPCRPLEVMCIPPTWATVGDEKSVKQRHCPDALRLSSRFDGEDEWSSSSMWLYKWRELPTPDQGRRIGVVARISLQKRRVVIYTWRDTILSNEFWSGPLSYISLITFDFTICTSTPGERTTVC